MERKWPESMQWTENDVADRGYRNREQMDILIARAMSYLMDSEKRKRLDANLCNPCFYGGSSLVGQAFTKWNCRVCIKDQPDWSNTSPPLICDKCSKKHKLCKRCGADVYLRVKRSNVKVIE